MTDTLFVTDAEMYERLGVPEDVARATIHQLDAKRTGFPQKQALWGDRRYWPAVMDYLDKQNKVGPQDRVIVSERYKHKIPRD